MNLSPLAHAASSTKNYGMRVTFPGEIKDWKLGSINDSYKQAKAAKINIAQYYPEWGKIEKKKGKYDWSELDNNIKFTTQAGMKASLIVKIVDNFKIGHLPDDIHFKSFDDAELVSRFSKFILAMLDRYKGKVEYLYIGNEIDIYFHNNKNQVAPYINLYRKVYSVAKPKHKNVKFGIVATYHDAHKNGALGMVQKIGKTGDVLGFTIYPQMMGKQPSDTAALLDDMSSIAAKVNKKFTITEAGFSSKGYAGSEQKQADFVAELYRWYKKPRNMDCLSMFILYDLPPSINNMVASNYGAGSNKDFLEWNGSLGLLKNNGKAKKAWVGIKSGFPGKSKPSAAKVVKKKLFNSKKPNTHMPAGLKAIDLKNLTGLGGTTSVKVKNRNNSTLVWKYKFSNVGNMSMIADFKTKFDTSSNGLAMDITSKEDTVVAIVMIEHGDINYEKYVELKAGKVKSIKIPWQEFKLQQGHKDSNNKLDLDKIKSWTIIDTSGFSGKSGNNKLKIRNLGIN